MDKPAISRLDSKKKHLTLADQANRGVQEAENVKELALDTDDGKQSRLGWLFFVFGFCGFLVWAATAPLDQGSVVPATLVAEGNRKSIQHLTGGIIQKIHVKEGQKVKAGELLVELNPVRTEAEASALRARWINYSAIKARLVAEMTNSKQIEFPQWFNENKDDPRVRDAIGLQNQLFQSKVNARRAELAALSEGVKAQEAVLNDLSKGSINVKESVQIKEAQLKAMKEMVEAGYLAKNRYLDAQREFNSISSASSQDSSQISQVTGRLNEARQQLAARRSVHLSEVQSELTNLQSQLSEVTEQLTTATFNEENNQVRSPVDGFVVGMRIFTEGGVVGGGQPMMDIAPSNARMELAGQLETNQVDKVKEGMKVTVAFSSLNHAHTPELTGVIKTIAADSIVDEKTGIPHYPIRFSLDDSEMEKLNKYSIQPGIPAEVFINVGERTMLNYLFKPLIDRMRTSMTEE
ncbi:MAG: HlyD family type I secretion periplasmic adaptor subunit [Limnobacter sp.]|nr:HlyD family type I secretion periplasmic adaptor subunit [Limnobacter sp.]